MRETKPGLIVLGGGISHDGQPSSATEANALQGIKLIKDRAVDEGEIFALGRGPEKNFLYEITEADVIAGLISQYTGVKAAKDSVSTDTFMNFEQFNGLRTAPDDEARYLVVATEGHSQRAELIGNLAFKHTGIVFEASPSDEEVSEPQLKQERLLRKIAELSFKGILAKDPAVRLRKAGRRYNVVVKPLKKVINTIRPSERYESVAIERKASEVPTLVNF